MTALSLSCIKKQKIRKEPNMLGLTKKSNLEISEALLKAALNDLDTARMKINILEDRVVELEGKSSQARLNEKLLWMANWEVRDES
jgi:hypothetical protein